MRFLLTAVVVVLSGCGSIYKTQVESSSERTVIIRNTGLDMAKSQVLADAECGKYKRFARLSGVMRGTLEGVYDCVL